MAQANLNPSYRFSPAQMRALLTNPATGTPSDDPPNDRIGIMPDLRAIIESDRIGGGRLSVFTFGTSLATQVTGTQVPFPRARTLFSARSPSLILRTLLAREAAPRMTTLWGPRPREVKITLSMFA